MTTAAMSATSDPHPSRPPLALAEKKEAGRAPRAAMKRARDAAGLGAYLLTIAAVIWLVYRGTQSIDYVWQWHRVPPYIFRIVDGRFIAGPLLDGLLVTVEISVLALLFAVLFGLACALARRGPGIVLPALAVGYVGTIRNTPLLIQIYLFYFVISPIFSIGRFETGVLSLALFQGAYLAEIFRAGIDGVHRGQWEAAAALGLRKSAIYRKIVLPQAVRMMLPPVVGQALTLVKQSAIVSVIAIADLMTEGRNAISDSFMPFEIWGTVALLYLVLTIGLSIGASWIEQRLKNSHR